MVIRRILCLGDNSALVGMQLLTLAKLLARAITNHLSEYAIVIDLNLPKTSHFYQPGMPPTTLNLPDMASVDGAIPGVFGGIITKPVHVLVVGDVPDADIAAFVGSANKYFDVVTQCIPYAHRFLPLPGNATHWVKTGGRAMPAIMLPANATGNAGNATFYTIDDGWNAVDPPERDACRMRLIPMLVNAAASENDWTLINAATRATFERWARTVTWRRVGICISGGGAAVFRLSHLFEALEAKHLPIDMIAGVSGGTVFAACYATGGMDKVHALANRGTSMTAAFMGSLVSSTIVKYYMDNFFHDCGVCNTEIRLLALCTALAPASPPRPTVVMDGTMGDAIRASGGAPFFGPYFDDNDARQTDGAIMAGLPPPFLAERFGADIIFAMNILSLPKNRFPGETVPFLGGFLNIFYRYTPLGRLADTWTATSTMLHTISEGAGLHADAFVDAPPRNGAAIEQALFFNANKYVNRGLDGLSATDLDNLADEFVLLWRALT